MVHKMSQTQLVHVLFITLIHALDVFDSFYLSFVIGICQTVTATCR